MWVLLCALTQSYNWTVVNNCFQSGRRNEYKHFGLKGQMKFLFPYWTSTCFCRLKEHIILHSINKITRVLQFFMLLLLARVTFFPSAHSLERVILGQLGCEITILRKDAFYKTWNNCFWENGGRLWPQFSYKFNWQRFNCRFWNQEVWMGWDFLGAHLKQTFAKSVQFKALQNNKLHDFKK